MVSLSEGNAAESMIQGQAKGAVREKDDFARRSLRSGAISIIAQAVNTGVQIVTTIWLARLLMPEDFGLVAMVSALTGFANVFMDLGTRDAAVQKSHLTHDDLSALFWLTVGMGGSFTIFTVLGSPLIAELFHESQLASIAKIWGLAFVLTALSCQHAALLRRELMFRKIALIEIAANVVGAGGAIGIALSGGGYWALVWRPVLTAFFTLVLVWSNCRWIPGLPAYSHSVKETIKFGLHITGFTITDYVARAADRVGLGYLAGAKDLGYYQNASTVHDNAVTVLAHPLHSVAVATLSKLRGNLDELRASWATALSSLAFFGMPAFAILAVIGPDLLVVLLGEKWAPAGVILIAFALRGPAQLIERTLGWLHVAAGRADRWARWGVFSCIVQVVAILCGLPFGAMGVATSFTICMYLLFVPAILYAGKPVGIKVSHLWSAIAPQLFGSLVTAGVGLASRFSYLADLSRFERMSILILECAAVYLFVTVICFKVTKPLEVARKLASGFAPLRGFNWMKSAK